MQIVRSYDMPVNCESHDEIMRVKRSDNGSLYSAITTVVSVVVDFLSSFKTYM